MRGLSVFRPNRADRVGRAKRGKQEKMSDATATRPRVAFQGEPGAFSSQAAEKLLGSQLTLAPCESFDVMFAAVENGA